MDDPSIPNDESVWNGVGSLIDIEDMRDAIRKGADVNEVSPWHSHTPLHLATLLDQTEIEPPRESRRLVGVSHAAMASSRCC